MSKITIEQWLHKPDNYDVGRQLYAQFGDNEVMNCAFGMANNKYLHNLLIEELTKVAGRSKKQIQVEEPVVIQAARKRWLALYKECAHIHASLRHLLHDEERKAAALTILNNMDDVEHLWSIIDNWEATGALPIETSEKPRDFQGWEAVDLMKEKLLIASYISNQKKKIQKGAKSATKMQEWANKLAIKENEYELIKKILNHGE